MAAKKSSQKKDTVIKLEPYDTDRYREILKEIIPEEYIKSFHRDYLDVFVWDMAHQFTVKLYKLTLQFPESVFTTVTSPLRHASSTIASRLVMTWSPRSLTDTLVLLKEAMDFAIRTSYLVRLCRDLELIEEKKKWELHGDIHRIEDVLAGCINEVKEKIDQQQEQLKESNPEGK
jgi:four helix bundle protein